jgi:ATP-dependent phosphofructokinase / diphosphate-dependent phosphofructokinase
MTPGAAPINKIAIVVGGGPAPGINGVIAAVTIEGHENNGIEVLGIQDGYQWVMEGRTAPTRRLVYEDVRNIHLRGGSVLGTSRANPTKEDRHMQNVLRFFREQGIDALVSIGGDDTAFTASQVHKRAEGRIRVAHVPKTIDNDLPLLGNTPTFGFETARHVGVQIVRNLGEDARTTSRWYIIVSMGRAAGHLALGIGKAAPASLTIIPEEFTKHQLTLELLCDIIIGAIIKRMSLGSTRGVCILAEGLIEALNPDELKQTINDANGAYGTLAVDPFGNLRMGEIEFGRMIRGLVAKRLQVLDLKVPMVDKDLGYELRCADPIPFDAEYTRDLGYGAVKYLCSEDSTRYGAIISYEQGSMRPLRFEDMLDPNTKRMATRIVNVKGESYECARRYMTRLEPRDFTNPERLAKLARVVKMQPDDFTKRFGYVVGLPNG